MQINYLIAPDVGGNITLHVHNVTFDVAFRSVLHALEPSLTFEGGGLYYIRNRSETSGMETNIALYHLPVIHMTAKEAFRHLENIGAIVPNQDRVYASDTDHCLTMLSTETTYLKVRQSLSAIDLPTPQVQTHFQIVTASPEQLTRLGIDPKTLCDQDSSNAILLRAFRAKQFMPFASSTIATASLTPAVAPVKRDVTTGLPIDIGSLHLEPTVNANHTILLTVSLDALHNFETPTENSDMHIESAVTVGNGSTLFLGSWQDPTTKIFSLAFITADVIGAQIK